MAGSRRSRTPRAARGTRWSSRLIALGLVLLLTGLLLRAGGTASSAGPRTFASGGGGSGSASGILTVNLTDAPSFTPNSLTANSGSAVAIHLTNVGSFPHTFTVAATNATLNRSWSPSQVDQFFRTNGTWANVSLAGGASAWANFTIPEAAVGSYEFVSVVPYQFQAGMFGYLNVTAAGGGGGVSLQDETANAGLAFVPSVLVANASAFPTTIDVAVSNLGSNAHTWTLVAQPDVNVTAGDFTSYFQSHPPAANVNVPLTPGQVVWANFTVTQKGVYQFICEIPGHLGAGMEGYLYIGVPAPAVVAPPSTAIVEPALLLAGGALLVIGVALALAASLVGRIPTPAYGPKH